MFRVLSLILQRLSLKGYSVWTLIAANIGALIIAWLEGWSLLMIIAVYIGQTVIIGFMQCIRILALKHFDVTGIKDRYNKQIPATVAEKNKTAIVAFLSLLMVGCVFSVFWSEGFGQEIKMEWFGLLVSLSLFAFHHLFSFFYYIKQDRTRKRSIGRLLGIPMVRIVPIILTIVIALSFIEVGFLQITVSSNGTSPASPSTPNP